MVIIIIIIIIIIIMACNVTYRISVFTSLN